MSQTPHPIGISCRLRIMGHGVQANTPLPLSDLQEARPGSRVYKQERKEFW